LAPAPTVGGMTTNTHIQRCGRLRRRSSILALVLSIGAGSLAGTAALPAGPSAAAPARAAARTQAYSYGWPIKPFDRRHPIRGYFGDPRTVFAGPPTQRGLLHASGDFSFHRGVDISAPNGTPVYPVASGVVSRIADELIVVDSGNGLQFEYWHLVRQVSVGDGVTKDATVLGRIMAGAQHVHLSELRDGRLVNPLVPGHLGPYLDTTRPTVAAIAFRRPNAAEPMLPYAVSGTVELLAEATDTPPLPVPGMWHGLPVSPAALSYRIRLLKTGRVVVPNRWAMDVRNVLPASGSLWQTYARGTHMNMPQFGKRRFWYQPGAYLFRLTPGPFDTRRLRNGVYELTVTAWDTAGNHGSAAQVFTVQNG
jgi:murein DD-endopeptidase MepM/ murein hydrolase activator NlpD